MNPGTDGVREGLETALLDDPGDDEAWSVFGDWLAGQGDPRGELLTLELALSQRRERKLVLRRNRLLSDHVSTWFKAELWRVIHAHPFVREHLLAEVSDLESGIRSWSSLRRLPALLEGRDEALILGGRAGFVSTVRFGPELQTRATDTAERRQRPAAVLRHLLDSPAAKLVRTVELGRQDAACFQRALQRKAARGIRELTLISHGDEDLDWLPSACPSLETLALGRSLFFAPPPLPRLRSLTIFADGFTHGRAVPLGLTAPRLRQLVWVRGHASALADVAQRPWPTLTRLILQSEAHSLVRSLRVLAGSTLSTQLLDLRLRVEGPAEALVDGLDEFEREFAGLKVERVFAENLSASQPS